jgi:hypothetical protein
VVTKKTAEKRPPVKPRPAAAEEVDYSASLYVSELPAPCDEEQIRTLFGVYGKLKKVELPPKKAYCFVTFETAAAAESALKAGPLSLDGVELKMAGRRPAPTYSARVHILCDIFRAFCFLVFLFHTAFIFCTPLSPLFPPSLFRNLIQNETAFSSRGRMSVVVAAAEAVAVVVVVVVRGDVVMGGVAGAGATIRVRSVGVGAVAEGGQAQARLPHRALKR